MERDLTGHATDLDGRFYRLRRESLQEMAFKLAILAERKEWYVQLTTTKQEEYRQRGWWHVTHKHSRKKCVFLSLKM
jgi:hypothetical protein